MTSKDQAAALKTIEEYKTQLMEAAIRRGLSIQEAAIHAQRCTDEQLMQSQLRRDKAALKRMKQQRQ